MSRRHRPPHLVRAAAPSAVPANPASPVAATAAATTAQPTIAASAAFAALAASTLAATLEARASVAAAQPRLLRLGSVRAGLSVRRLDSGPVRPALRGRRV